MRHRGSSNGFTLIELLIVVAIIGILAAVLIPNLLGARQRAFDAGALQCARAIALTAEGSRTSLTSSNWDFTAGDVTTFDPASCGADYTLTGLPVADSATFTVTVTHLRGRTTYTVEGDAAVGVTVN